MTKLLTVLLLAFMIYTFVSVNTLAKAEIARTTIDIPVKITQYIANIMASVDEARAAPASTLVK
jgi:hypothetical protein